MTDAKFVTKKLDLMRMYYGDLEMIINGFTVEQLRRDPTRFYAIERVFQLIVDEMIDINNHIIKHNNLDIPDDYQSTFKILGNKKILPEEFAYKISPAVGLRNRIVHRYEELDKELAIKSIFKERGDFIEYIKLINKYIKK